MTCFEYTFQYAQKNPTSNAQIVHADVNPAKGVLSSTFANQAPYTYAWIEKDGFIYDAAGQSWSMIDFYKVYQPTFIKKYTPKEVLKRVATSLNKGPWE